MNYKVSLTYSINNKQLIFIYFLFLDMYHCVQCFALVLKINIFFQVLFLISTSIITHNYVFRIITAVMSGIIMISIVFSRISITRESHWMMCIFLAFQLILLICIAYCIVGLFQYSDLWTIGMVYCKLLFFYLVYNNTISFYLLFLFIL